MTRYLKRQSGAETKKDRDVTAAVWIVVRRPELVFFRGKQDVEDNRGNTARGDAGRQERFQPLRRELQDKRLLRDAKTDRQRQRDNHYRPAVEAFARHDTHARRGDGTEHDNRRAAQHRFGNVLYHAADSMEFRPLANTPPFRRCI